MKKIIISENIFQTAADRFAFLAKSSTAGKNQFTVALAGGSTPKELYRLLAGEKYRSKIDWSKVFFFFGDERNVLPDDPQSNFKMADENLFRSVGIEPKQVFRWPTELKTPQLIARTYTENLIDFFNLHENELPRFDLVLLGLGDDGHTASLFPSTDALRETSKPAVENYVEKLDSWRLTLTFPVINNARHVIFLVSGEKKAQIIKSVLENEIDTAEFPAQNVNPAGELLFMLDRSAAKLLEPVNLNDEI